MDGLEWRVDPGFPPRYEGCFFTSLEQLEAAPPKKPPMGELCRGIYTLTPAMEAI